VGGVGCGVWGMECLVRSMIRWSGIGMSMFVPVVLCICKSNDQKNLLFRTESPEILDLGNTPHTLAHILNPVMFFFIGHQRDRTRPPEPYSTPKR
jgi:hypothetical protein